MSNFTFSTRQVAIAAGGLYLAVAVFGIVAFGVAPQLTIVPGDAVATAVKISENQGMFRLGMVAESLVVLTEVAITSLLYVFFKPVNATLSLMAAVARLGMTVVQAINIIFKFAVLALVGGAGYLAAFEPGQLQALTQTALNLHAYGMDIWQLLFGMHLILLGYLALVSGFVPKWLGWSLMVGSLGYLGTGYSHMLGIDNGAVSIAIGGFLAIASVGEIAFGVWLLVWGGKDVQK